MENSRTPLVKWITTIWLVSQHHMTINAVQLSSIIQVTYKTAWSMLHKVRSVISAIDSDSPLEGTVQGVVEYHAKPPFRALYELSSREIPLIVAASVSLDEEIINLKIKKVDRQLLISKSLHPAACSQFIERHTCANVEEITIIKQPFRTIQFAYLKKQFQRARRWMIDTFHGIGPTYLQRYLDEFCFRSNAISEHFSAWELLMSMSLSARYGSISRRKLSSTLQLAA
ncbi:transposase [Paenibacillus marinisediminis]